jgi:microcin C transport system substrate-binding protein
MISIAASFSATPTFDDLDGFIHSRRRTSNGSRNLPGTADPAVDALLEAIEAERPRGAGHGDARARPGLARPRDWIPNWYAANHRAAYWDMFGFKEPKPDYGFPVETLWWFDAEERRRAIGKA